MSITVTYGPWQAMFCVEIRMHEVELLISNKHLLISMSTVAAISRPQAAVSPRMIESFVSPDQ
jgi:hypothetical protein